MSGMTAKDLKCWLAERGCVFETYLGGGGEVTVRLGDRTSQLPAHETGKELGSGLVGKIKKDLGLK